MMPELPLEITTLLTTADNTPDDIFIIAASWEARCLGVATKACQYSAKQILMTVYDGKSELRENNINRLTELLSPVGNVRQMPAKHDDTLENVRSTVKIIKETAKDQTPTITIDTTTFTRKHLLQLLQALDASGLLLRCRLLYTEPTDYLTSDTQPISQGVSSVRAIETFIGLHHSSNDNILVLFLGYEGKRTAAIVDHLEPNITIAVVPDPPYHESWRGRTELQNDFLFSSIDQSRVFYTDSLRPEQTQRFLEDLSSSDRYSADRYNYVIAPMGTKSQAIGIYRFWRNNPTLATIIYASPIRYRQEQALYPAGRTWLIDDTQYWSPLAQQEGRG